MSLIGLGIGEAIQGAGMAAQGAGMAAQGAGNAVNGIAIGAGTAIAKLGDVLLSPINMMCNWAEEPLRKYEHDRQEESKDNDVQRTIELEVGVEIALSKQKMKENELSTNLKIKRETEVFRIITEIEQLKKDKEFERMKMVSDAMMEYQKELTRINVDAVEAIGSMRIDLQRKAYELIHEKTQQYAELQDRAIHQAQEQLDKIDNNPNLSENSKNVLSNAVGEKLAGTIKNATRFIEQLNNDMQLISKDINLITTSGQKFIERHLEQFQLIGFSENTTALLGKEDSIYENDSLCLNLENR
jgi:hypothetical protein